MACFTVVRVVLEDDVIIRKARKNLGYPVRGVLLVDARAVEKARVALRVGAYATPLQVENAAARAVQAEAKILTGIAQVKRINPRAVIRRVGNKVTVRVEV